LNLANSICTRCAVGKYGLEYGRTTVANCVECEIGFYNDVSGLGACKGCAVGKYGTGRGYTSLDDCQECSPSKYNNQLGQTVCKDCLAGFYSNTGETVDCIGCPSGRYGENTGQSVMNVGCLKCVKGKYQSSVGQDGVSACTDCPGGKFGTVLSQTSLDACKDCEPGKHAPPSDNGADGCTNCSNASGVQMFSHWGELFCYWNASECRVGHYADLDNYACEYCPEGRYNDVVGLQSALECKSCIAGRYGMGEGLKLLSQCQNCTKGKYNEELNATGCKNCTVGTYGDALRLGSSDLCKKCSTGQYSNELGQIICIDCQRGQYNDQESATQCKGCRIGRYGNQLRLSSYTNCPECFVGQFNDDVGKVTCKYCVAGKTNFELGLSVCDYHDQIVKFGGSYGSFGFDDWARYVVDDAGKTEGLCDDVEGRNPIDTKKKCHDFLKDRSMCDVGSVDDVTQVTATNGLAPKGCSVKKNGNKCKAFFKPLAQLGGKCGVGSDFYTCICKLECPTGTFQNEPGMSGCKNCPTGFYNGQPGKSLCFKCPRGKIFSCGCIFFICRHHFALTYFIFHSQSNQVVMGIEPDCTLKNPAKVALLEDTAQKMVE